MLYIWVKLALSVQGGEYITIWYDSEKKPANIVSLPAERRDGYRTRVSYNHIDDKHNDA